MPSVTLLKQPSRSKILSWDFQTSVEVSPELKKINPKDHCASPFPFEGCNLRAILFYFFFHFLVAFCFLLSLDGNSNFNKKERHGSITSPFIRSHGGRSSLL